MQVITAEFVDSIPKICSQDPWYHHKFNKTNSCLNRENRLNQTVLGLLRYDCGCVSVPVVFHQKKIWKTWKGWKVNVFDNLQCILVNSLNFFLQKQFFEVLFIHFPSLWVIHWVQYCVFQGLEIAVLESICHSGNIIWITFYVLAITRMRVCLQWSSSETTLESIKFLQNFFFLFLWYAIYNVPQSIYARAMNKLSSLYVRNMVNCCLPINDVNFDFTFHVF